MASSDYLRLLKNDKAHEHRHAGKVEMEPSLELPEAPASMPEREKEIFNDLLEIIGEMYTPSRTDLDMMILYCNNQTQLEHYEGILREEGSTIKVTKFNEQTEKEMILSVKARPEVAMLHSCKKLKIELLGHFGLSPLSRGKVKMQKATGKKSDNPFNNL